MVKKIELNFETYRALCEFVLISTSEEPIAWDGLMRQILTDHEIENDEPFRWLYSRCIAKMIEENWVVKTSDDPLFKIGISFKGRTVLRHKDEIRVVYERHFASAITKVSEAKASARKKRELQLKPIHKVTKQEKRKAKRLAKAATKRKADPRSASPAVAAQRSKIDLFGSGKKIRESIPSKDNDQLLKLWKSNTIGAASSSGAKREQHLLIVTAVEKEWKRRIRELPENEAFKWPSTDVGGGAGGGDFERQEISYLKILGYTVGKTDGLPASSRRLILDRCFTGQLPPYQSVAELRKWGEPKSSGRLKKMAYHIASLAKNFKKMPSRGYDDAIADWEDDLKYLHDTYYVQYFHFSWPSR
ncbi:hypothetical protein [Rhodophyticola sp.]|uniref:hypothetical protein n=1 Tax=Rhodophyticola sp. TaxID=2680032 RepID=UPI003D2A7BD6